MLLVRGVGLCLEVVRAGPGCIWAFTFGLDGVDSGEVLGGVLGRQGRAFEASLEADTIPEDIQRTNAFDGAEAA